MQFYFYIGINRVKSHLRCHDVRHVNPKGTPLFISNDIHTGSKEQNTSQNTESHIIIHKKKYKLQNTMFSLTSPCTAHHQHWCLFLVQESKNPTISSKLILKKTLQTYFPLQTESDVCVSMHRPCHIIITVDYNREVTQLLWDSLIIRLDKIMETNDSPC